MELGGDVIAGFILLLFVLFLSVFILDMVVNYPYASEDALQQCLGRGFDYAVGFDRAFFSNKALGVKCGIIEINRKNIQVDLNQSGNLLIN